MAQEAYERQEYATALRIWRPFAETGYSFSQYSLGWMYHHGEGVPVDLEEAAKWYRKAADQNHLSAQNNLAYMYENGEGVAKDLAQALKLYSQCSAGGLEKCAPKVKELEEALKASAK